MAPSKKQSRGADADIDSFLQQIQPAKFSNDQAAGYFLAAFALTLVPAYLYHSVYEMSFSEYGLLYLLVTVACSAALTLAYRNVEQSTQSYLSSSRKGHGSAAKTNDALLFQESLSWSLLLNNAIFIGAFLFLAFYALRSIETMYNYILSMVMAAAVTWQLSGTR